VQAFRREVHARAREVLTALIRSLGDERIPPREVEPLAELMSMGMASLVLWWIDNPATPREALIDAMTRVWAGLLADPG
jgi:hypothetical protein